MNTLTNLWLAATADGRGVDVFGQVFESKGMVLAVLIVLVCLSVACWFIIGAKTVSIARATKQSRSFIHAFRKKN